MHFEGRVEIAAPRDKVWSFVIDPTEVGQCGPGVESVEAVDDSHFKARAKVGIGFISARFNAERDTLAIMGTKAKVGAAAAVAVAGVAAWQRVSPSACPYAQRWLLHVPRPWLTPARLAQVLEPRDGERLLEVGPGTGVYALPMAKRVAPTGTVAGLDLQQKMLDDLDRRAAQAGATNLELRQGDATALPYEDASVDGAFLVTVLGEVPDRDAALRELRRVLRPGGRVVFGETALDPHLVTLRTLKQEAQAAGLRFERQLGVPPLGFYARFSVV